MTEFLKLKGNDSTEEKYIEADNVWDLRNAIKQAYKQKNEHQQKKTFMQ